MSERRAGGLDPPDGANPDRMPGPRSTDETAAMFAGTGAGWVAGFVTPFVVLFLGAGPDPADSPRMLLAAMVCLLAAAVMTLPAGCFGAAYAVWVRDRRGAAWRLDLTAAAGAYATACAGWVLLAVAWAVL